MRAGAQDILEHEAGGGNLAEKHSYKKPPSFSLCLSTICIAISGGSFSLLGRDTTCTG